MTPLPKNEDERLREIARFWSKVDKRGADDCWLWTGARSAGSQLFYGSLRAGGRTVRAHRFSYEIAHGPIPPGAVVRHTCDTPLCVNPAHLLVGTQRDNMQDCTKRGRAGARSGSSNSYAKLDETQVREIRAALDAKVSQYVLARQYGVSQYAIRYARRGWRHLSEGSVDA